MSNVLIGIIGVILFIGLALAGALILGDDFRSASTTSEAAAVTSQLQQVQSAIEMYRLKTGQRNIPNQNTSFLVPRFLKVAAVNPTRWSKTQSVAYWKTAFLNNDIGPNENNEAMAFSASWVQIIVGPTSDSRAKDICLAIEEGVGRSSIPSLHRPTYPIGCASDLGYYSAYATFGS